MYHFCTTFVLDYPLMITIFVRHSRVCLEGDGTAKKPGLKSLNLSEDKLRYYKKCSCPKWYSGTYNGKRYPRTSADACTWEAAEKVVQKIKDAIDGKVFTGPVQAPELTPGEPIDNAIRQWLQECETEEIVIRPFNELARLLEARAAVKKITGVRQITSTFVSDWKASWMTEQSPRKKEPGLKLNTRKSRQRRFNHFLNFCVRMSFLDANPLAKLTVKRHRKRRASRGLQIAQPSRPQEIVTATLPIDPEGGTRDYDRILMCIPKFFAPKTGKNGERYVRRACLGSRPANFGLLLELMYHCGLRVSDAILFQIDLVKDEANGYGSYTFEQYKTGGECTVVIEPWLLRKLRALPRITPNYLFWDGSTAVDQFECNQVGEYLRGIGAHLGITKLHAHRFRDSFAVNKLNEGWEMKKVSLALGHKSVQVTEIYYSPWVGSRKKAFIGGWINSTVEESRVVPISA